MKKRYIGHSRDYRTGRWKIICECGKEIFPETTMLRYQEVVCPKCGKQETIDYNEEEKA